MTLAILPAWDIPPVTLSAGDKTNPPTIAGLAMPLNTISRPSRDGRRYMFAGPPENLDELVDVVREHNTDDLVGRLNAWTITDAGLEADARLFDTSKGRDVLVEIREGARTGFSLGARIQTYSDGADGVRTVTQWSVDHLGVVRNPAFTETHVNASFTERQAMPEETPATPAVAPAPDVVELPTVAELAAKVAEHLAADKPAASPLAQFASFADYLEAFAKADADKIDELAVNFAIPDQITTNNPGVIPPGWRTQIQMNLDARTPAINAFGRIGLPDTGMDDNWPYFDGEIDSIIAQQETEKTELSGVRIDIKKATEALKTAGAVSDISYQLLMRSTPSYLDAYLRIMMAAFARYEEKQFETALLARATRVDVLPDLSTVKATRAALFAASADVEDAIGAPADVVFVDRATFITLGQLDTLNNPKYGTQNLDGIADASSLRVNINGLEVRRAPFFPASTMLVGSSHAAKFPSSGPMIATEEEVTKLGRNVAVWGMYEDAHVYFPAALRVYKPAA